MCFPNTQNAAATPFGQQLNYRGPATKIDPSAGFFGLRDTPRIGGDSLRGLLNPISRSGQPLAVAGSSPWVTYTGPVAPGGEGDPGTPDPTVPGPGPTGTPRVPGKRLPLPGEYNPWGGGD
jgi:hypothetical protein